MSFMFGAVAAIKFGPLSGHGHVMAGIFIEKKGDERIIGAIFEALGEGSIACFSMCVYLRVKLEHRSSDGALDGSAEYSVSFKVGFFSVSFRFEVRKRIAGGNSSGGGGSLPLPLPSPLPLAVASPRYFVHNERTVVRTASLRPSPADREYVTKTPSKLREWRVYKTRVAMDLIKP